MGCEPRDGDFYLEGCVRFFRIVVGPTLYPSLRNPNQITLQSSFILDPFKLAYRLS